MLGVRGARMLFTDVAHPSTIAVPLVEVALLAAACAATFRPVPALVQPGRGLARGLAGAVLLIGLGLGTGMAIELWTAPLPFVEPDAPLGTYARMTNLGLLLAIAQVGLVMSGAALAFRRSALGSRLLVLAGSLGLLDEARRAAHDPSLPPSSLAVGVLLGGLLLATLQDGTVEPMNAREPPARGPAAHHGVLERVP